MLGQMMQMPLTIGNIITHAERYHSDTEIVSVETNGGVSRSNWGSIGARARKLADVLGKFGLEQGDRCGTIAWNNHRHLELYFGLSSPGFVCHTINPRLSPEQMVYVVNHAGDRVLFIDETFIPLVEKLEDQMPNVELFVILSNARDDINCVLKNVVFYDEFIEKGSEKFQWPQLDENTASSICYTSGTTGHPKGVLYSHRSTTLHSLVAAMPDNMAMSACSTLLPVVPMFHVNAWSVPYAAALTGAKLVLPGPKLDGHSLVKLIDEEAVTMALGVPTIWQGLISAAKDVGSKLTSLESTVVGGAACPPTMIDAFREEFDVDTIHAWGMTEMSPLGTMNRPLSKHSALPIEEQRAVRVNQGRPPFGVELRIVDDEGAVLPNDGVTQGNLHVRGHWVVDTYFNIDAPSPLEDGFFPTGDIATIDPDGYMTIRDRAKDIIKSGGEWISSVEIENIAIGHPAIADAAVIGVAHAKWDERPLLLAVLGPEQSATREELLQFIAGSVPTWQVPDDVVFIDTIPRNATGKILKKTLREEYASYLLEKKPKPTSVGAAAVQPELIADEEGEAKKESNSNLGLEDGTRNSLDEAMQELRNAAEPWAQTSAAHRLSILSEVKNKLMENAEEWAKLASQKKQIPLGAQIEGEEWISGPYAVMAACNGLMETLSKLENKSVADGLKVRTTMTGQSAVKVLPHSVWDRLLLSGVSAEIWLKPGTEKQALQDIMAVEYDIPPEERIGRVALVLGAGNIAAIAPLDCFQKLFTENQVVILKLNPVNDYLEPILSKVLAPLIEFGALRIVTGDVPVGAYLCDHPETDEIHITGAKNSHDAIVWGVGEEADVRKRERAPKNVRRITSELGAVCPTIVVPGPWSAADIAFQAEHIATQKLHNSGFNCVAAQTLILSRPWKKSQALMNALKKELSASTRPAYYPGAVERLNDFAEAAETTTSVERAGAPACILAHVDAEAETPLNQMEVFAPGLAVVNLDDQDPETFLEAAIAFANEKLFGTLGANVLIHPSTINKIGRQRFETLIGDLKYGGVSINCWTGLNFLVPQCSWGAFPGHSLEDVQSGVGVVHNSYMFEDVERCVVEAPFRPFPRGVLSGRFSLLPRPPWFITNKRGAKLGELLTKFQYKPSLAKIPRILWNALLG